MKWKNQICMCLFFLLACANLFGQLIDCKTLLKRLVTLTNSSNLLHDKYPEELLKYETASLNSSYRTDSCRISLLEQISKIYVARSDYKHATDYILKAINLVATNFNNPSINPSCQIKNYYSLAAIYDSLNKTTEKMTAYDSCIAVAKRLKLVNVFFLYALRQNVEYQFNIGDYEMCISQAELGEKLSRQYLVKKNMKTYGDSASFSLDFAIQKVNALHVLEKYNEAETLLLQKLKTCKSGNLQKYLGVLYEQMALTKMQQKNYIEALKYFNHAKKSYKNGNLINASLKFQYKEIIHNIGYLYAAIQKKSEKGLYYYNKALNIKIDDSKYNKLDSINTLNIYSSIGNVYARMHQFDSAQMYFQYAFNLINRGTNETEVLHSSLDDFIRNQKVEYLTGLYANKGDALYKQYEYTKNPVFVNKAIRMFRVTDQLFERVKGNQFEIGSKLFWRKITHPFYEQAIEACINAGRTEDAFFFFERSRAVLLYDQMKEQRGFSETDILEQRKLQKRSIELQQLLVNIDTGSPRFSQLQNEIADLKDLQNGILKKIKLKNPLYFSNFLDSNFTRLDDTRRKILNDHALVEIFTGDSCVYSMIVTKKEIYFNRINKVDYDSTIYRCLAYMSDYNLVKVDAHFNTFIKNSHHLYDLIFNGKNLPDGPIIFSEDENHFPFETLIINSVANQPVYFIQKHPVSYTYSARFLMNQFSQPSFFKPGNFLGIAPVKFPLKNHLPVLLGSDDAIRDVASLFNVSDTLCGDYATKNNFLTKFGRYQIVQIFSHSSDSSARGEPVLYFADEPLYLSEVSNIKSFATRLVVLSACKTGNGKFYQGEGVFSFNRAFAALGIPSCINNLWSVDNESTYKLSNLLYSNISKGLCIDEALQLAKVDYINSSSPSKQRPYYWAATILAGKSEAIKYRKNRLDYLKISLAILGFAVLPLALIIGTIKLNKGKWDRKKEPHLN